MELRQAARADLPQITSAYREIVQNMRENQLNIWDEVYPFACFQEDIRRGGLYLLAEQGKIAGAFALCAQNAGARHVGWEQSDAQAVYLDRLGAHPRYARKGPAGLLLAKAKGAESLPLFVVGCNRPAICLYKKRLSQSPRRLSGTKRGGLCPPGIWIRSRAVMPANCYAREMRRSNVSHRRPGKPRPEISQNAA